LCEFEDHFIPLLSLLLLLLLRPPLSATSTAVVTTSVRSPGVYTEFFPRLVFWHLLTAAWSPCCDVPHIIFSPSNALRTWFSRPVFPKLGSRTPGAPWGSDRGSARNYCFLV